MDNYGLLWHLVEPINPKAPAAHDKASSIKVAHAKQIRQMAKIKRPSPQAGQSGRRFSSRFAAADAQMKLVNAEAAGDALDNELEEDSSAEEAMAAAICEDEESGVNG